MAKSVSITVVDLKKRAVCAFCKQYKKVYRVILKTVGASGLPSQRYIACVDCVEDLKKKAGKKNGK